MIFSQARWVREEHVLASQFGLQRRKNSSLALSLHPLSKLSVLKLSPEAYANQ
jgi:hypothetical protein